jgi:hypothetical protein
VQKSLSVLLAPVLTDAELLGLAIQAELREIAAD